MAAAGAGGRCPPWRRRREAVRLLLGGVTVRTALPIALVIGTLLSAVNEGGALLAGRLGTGSLVKVAVNYLVPFLVASAGFLSSGRSE